MADKRIQDLTQATSVQTTDKFVLEQSGQAKSLTGQILINDLATALSGHGGISDITYTSPVSPSLDGTLTITLADTTTYDVTIENGNGIDSISVEYGISNSGVDPTYVHDWYSTVISPTDSNPYQWTRLGITDKTNTTTYSYTVTVKAENPTISVGTVSASSGATAGASISNSGTVYDPVLDFSFTLPKGDKGDTGDYIVPVVSYGTSTAAATQPTTWYSSPTSISYAAGNYIWKKTEYTLHDAQSVQDTETEIIGYIGQNGSGSGTVNQITFNGDVFADDGTGNITMNISPEDVDAIADPTTKYNGQVLTYDSSAGAWVAANPSTGNVNTVNNIGVTAGTTNIQLYATAIPMSSSDNTPVASAIPQASFTTPSPLGTADVGSGTTWARADHVHDMPSAADVGAVSTDDVQFKIYNSVEDLGLVSGSATIAGAWAAMSAQSILIATGNDFASSQVPAQLGTVEIVKGTNDTRGWIQFYGKDRGVGDYRMGLALNGGPSGTWTGAADLLRVVTSTASRTISIAADTGINVLSSGYVTEPAVPTGYTEVLHWGGASGAAQVVTVSIGSYWVQNTSAVAKTVTCYASKLCIRNAF